MGQMNNTHIDNQSSNRVSIAPVLSYEITPKTTLTAEYNYDMQRTNGLDMAIPSINGKFELPRNFNISNIDDKLKFQQEYVYTQLKHAFNDNWRVTAQFSYNEGFLTGYDVQSRGKVLKGDSVVREARYWDNNANNKNAQIFVNGRFKITKNISNDLYAGADLGEQYFKRLAITGVNSSVKNLPKRFSLRNPNYVSSADVQKLLPKPEDMPFQVPAVTRFKAVNFYNTTKFGQYVHLNWGGRYNWIETGTVIIKPDKAFTPRIGLSIFPAKNLNIYALRDQTYLPVAGKNKAGDEFVPQQGLNYEVGLKKQWLNGALSTNVAWFNITKTNGLTADPANVGFQIQQLEVQSQGVEFDIIGSPIPALSIVANYAYTDSRISKDNTNSKIIGRWEQVPLHNANIWAKYTLDKGKLKGLGIATGYSYLGSRKTLTIGLTDKIQQVELPDFKKIDAALSYQTGIFNFNLNIENLTNENNIYGTYDLRNTANVYNYLTTPGINWRFGVGIKL